MMKAPIASLATSRVPCNAGDVTVTDAPGNGRPCVSFTTPEMMPVCTPCAKAADVKTRLKKNERATASAVRFTVPPSAGPLGAACVHYVDYRRLRENPETNSPGRSVEARGLNSTT